MGFFMPVFPDELFAKRQPSFIAAQIFTAKGHGIQNIFNIGIFTVDFVEDRQGFAKSSHTNQLDGFLIIKMLLFNTHGLDS